MSNSIPSLEVVLDLRLEAVERAVEARISDLERRITVLEAIATDTDQAHAEDDPDPRAEALVAGLRSVRVYLEAYADEYKVQPGSFEALDLAIEILSHSTFRLEPTP